MWLTIKVLLWKSFKLRTRQWISSIIEILIPCLLFYLVYYNHDDNMEVDNTSKIEMYTTFIPSPVSENMLHEYFINNYASGFFIYTPKTLETEQIMNIVITKLKIPPDNIKIADNEDEMVQKFKKLFNSNSSNFKGFGIVFEETTNNVSLNYKIRSTSNKWQTNKLFPPNAEEDLGPMDSGNVYLKKGFISLQLTLDKAFIDLSLINNNIIKTDYNFNIQPYPYATSINKTQKNNKDTTVVEGMPLFTIISFLLMCSFTIKRVSEENESGVKELMKLMGVQSWTLWTGWILHNLFLYAITISIITYLCFFHSANVQVLNHINPFTFWIFLAMYMLAATFFCFAICSLFDSSVIAMIVGLIIWIGSKSLYQLFFLSSESTIIWMLLMLLPNIVVSYGYKFIFLLEYQESNQKLLTLFTTGEDHIYFPTTFLYMFLVQCFFYGFIAWYFDLVMPRKYGIAKPFDFLCKWCSKKFESNIMVPVEKKNSNLFENLSDEYEIGIRVQNLHKHFGDFYAVNGVNMNLYKGQITVLLGHNGAGKTTTMSIITGI